LTQILRCAATQLHHAGEIDTCACPRSLVAVSRFRNKLFAVVVMAVWLFATQHCGLEAAGLFAAHDEQAEDTGCCAAKGGCENDGCATVEDGEYRPDQRSLVISAPALAADLLPAGWEALLAAPLPADAESVWALDDRPHEWVTTWQFVQRAALSPRAPSVG
jgi:hypothetical protein